MTAQSTPESTLSLKKQLREDFLKSCCDNFITLMQEKLHHVAYYAPMVPHNITEWYYRLLPDIRAQLSTDNDVAPDSHPVDRHKIAAATASLILVSQPMRDAKQLHSSDIYEDGPCTHMNSQFAIYTSVAVLDQWRELSKMPKLIITKRAKRFIREHVKLMTKCSDYPIFFAAQTFYLFEELCLFETAFDSAACRKILSHSIDG